MLIIPISYKNKEDFYKKYITIFQGELKLTEKELTILMNLIKRFIELELKYKELTDIVLFESSNIIQLCKDNNMSINQYHNIKSALIEKQAIFKKKDGTLLLNRLLLPKKEITFKFIEDGRD